jgi:phage terminase large subunit GpA-like protein
MARDEAERREKRIVSFHLWEAYSPLSSLAEIVAASSRRRARRRRPATSSEMHTWQNTTLGEPVSADDGEGVESETLLIAARKTTVPDVDVPFGACCLTMGVDVQDDRLELLVIGWGPGEESWIVDRDTLPGDTSQPVRGDARRGARRAVPARRRADAAHPGDVHRLGGHRTTLVYDYAEKKAARRVYAIIGRDGSARSSRRRRRRRWGRGERQVPLYTIGVDAAKALLMDRLKVTEKGPATSTCRRPTGATTNSRRS